MYIQWLKLDFSPLGKLTDLTTATLVQCDLQINASLIMIILQVKLNLYVQVHNVYIVRLPTLMDWIRRTSCSFYFARPLHLNWHLLSPIF